jgi:glycosyltransferase involved in cell wall biosynthesis
MRVYFDARMIDHPGIGRYIRCLLPYVASDRSIELCLLGDREKIAKMLPFRADVIDFTYPIYSVQEQVGYLRLKKEIASALKGSRNDVVLHVPHYNIPVLAKFNLVATIHDITHILYPEGAKSAFGAAYMKFMVGRVLRSAKQVICVSDATKNEINKKFTPLRWERRPPHAHRGGVTVIHEGIDEVFEKIDDKEKLKRVKEKYNLPDKFILYVGSIRRHKNIGGLLNVFKKFNEKFPDMQLVIVGRYSQPIELNRPNVLYLGEVESDSALACIYNQAACLLNLSFYEGFGLTILEAQRCGLPVVCSDIPAHIEIGSGGILAVEASDIDQIYENLYNVLFNNDLRKTLISEGLENIKRFDWANTARQTLDLYRRMDDESCDSSRLVAGHAGRGKSPQCFLQNIPPS